MSIAADCVAIEYIVHVSTKLGDPILMNEAAPVFVRVGKGQTDCCFGLRRAPKQNETKTGFKTLLGVVSFSETEWR
jgi:hypothetical protein